MNAYVPKLDFSASPTLWQFLMDRAFFTLVEGPLGSGKSTVCVGKLMLLALQQEPDPRTNMRTTRWAVIRNTSVELKSTTIKTWLEIFPEASCGPIRYSAPITHRIIIPAVGTEPGLDMEVLFIAMDKPSDVKKLKSLDLTGAWVNEAVEVPHEAVDMLTGRVGRFPKKEHVPATWAGVFCDTNADDDQSWVHQRRMNAGRDLDLDPSLFDGMALDFNEHFYKQPPAMLECAPEGNGYRVIEAGVEPFAVPEKQAIPAAGRFWCMNPEAENIRYLRGGIGYYFQQMNGKDVGWIQRFVQAKTVYYVDGQPWVPEYSDETMARTLTYDPNLPLIGGMDIGGGTLNPAATIGQRGPLGDYRVLSELFMSGVGLDEFETALKALIAERFGNAKVKFGIDPAAKNRDPLYAATMEHHLTAKGFTVALAPTNSPVLRRQALASPMSRVVRAPGGVTVPGFLVDKSCTMLRAGLAGKWHKKRIQGSDGRFGEEPVKNQWSHACFPAGTMVATPDGQRAIETLRAGDFVLTPWGRRAISGAGITGWRSDMVTVRLADGRTLAMTPDHPVFVHGKGLVPADALCYADTLSGMEERPIWSALQSLCSTAKSTGFRDAITAGTSGARLGQAICTGRYGSIITAPFRRAMTFIISMAIRSTTTLPIWNAWRSARTAEITCASLIASQNPAAAWNSTPGPLRPSGMAAPKASNFTAAWASCLGKSAANSRPAWSSADTAPSRLKRTTPPASTCAATSAERKTGGALAWTMRIGRALIAAARSGATSTQRNAIAACSAVRLPAAVPVYNLTVPVDHCFYANGVLVSNCDAASYMCSTFGEHALLIERHDAAATDRGRAFQQARAGVQPMAMKVDFSGMFGKR